MEWNQKEKRWTMLVSQHRKTVILKNCQTEMLLNRESNPGLPRLVSVNDKRKS